MAAASMPARAARVGATRRQQRGIAAATVVTTGYCGVGGNKDGGCEAATVAAAATAATAATVTAARTKAGAIQRQQQRQELSSSTLTNCGFVVVNRVSVYILFSAIVPTHAGTVHGLILQFLPFIFLCPILSWVPQILPPISSILTWFFGSRLCHFHRLL